MPDSVADVAMVLGQIRDTLVQIRDVLAYTAMPPPAVETPGCPHPEPDRANMSSMSETRWICKRCKHEHVEPRLQPAAAG